MGSYVEKAKQMLARRLLGQINATQATPELIASMGTSMIAEPLSGFAGLAALPYGPEVSGNAVNYVGDMLSYSPRSGAAKEALGNVGTALAPIGEVLEGVSSGAKGLTS